jgi:hypothetical protein
MFVPVVTKKKKVIETPEELADKMREWMEDGKSFLEIREESFRLGFPEDFWLKATKLAYSFEGGDVKIVPEEIRKDSFVERYKFIIAGFVALIFLLGILVNNYEPSVKLTKTELLQQKLKALEAANAKKSEF